MCRRRVSHSDPLAGSHRGHHLEGSTGPPAGAAHLRAGAAVPPERLCLASGQGVGGLGTIGAPLPKTLGTQAAPGTRRGAAKAQLLRASAPQAGPTQGYCHGRSVPGGSPAAPSEAEPELLPRNPRG